MTETSPTRPNEPPWPMSWPPPRGLRGGLVAVFFAFLGVLALALGVRLLITRSFDARDIIGFAAAPAMLALSAVVVITRVRIRSRPSSAAQTGFFDGADEPGLLIQYPRSLCVAYLAFIVGLILGVGCLATIMLLVAFVGHPNIGALIVGLAFVAMVIFIMGFLVEAVRGNIVRGALLISPSAVAFRSWGSDAVIPWRSLQIVTDGSTKDQPIVINCYDNTPAQMRYRSGLAKPRRNAPPPTSIKVPGAFLSIDPALAFHTLRYYHAHPRARTELGTAAALDRLRYGNLLP